MAIATFLSDRRDEFALWLFMNRTTLIQRFCYKPDPKYGLSGFVQELHLPIGFRFQATTNARNQVGADFGHLSPSRIPVDEIEDAVGNAGEFAVADSKKIERHRENLYVRLEQQRALS